MTSRILRSGVRASRASSHTSATKSGIAYVCARAADGTWMRISGVAMAAIHIGEPPRRRAASIASDRAPTRHATSTR